MSKEKSTKHGIPFGWHVPKQRMVTAREVSNGRSCDCVCIACGSQLIARQGDVRIWHFAHDAPTQCQVAAEAAIHHMAKQLVGERGCIFLPERKASRDIYGQRRVWSETIYTEVQQPGLHAIKDCQVEKALITYGEGSTVYRPDVVASLNGHPLAIEILNTHAVEPEKAAWLEVQGYSALEIDVSDIALLPIDQMMGALEVRLFQGADYSSWLCHSGDREAVFTLDQIEADVRRRRQAEEVLLLAQLEAAEAALKRKEEYRQKIRDIDAVKIRISGCTVRIGRNFERVSLKVYGYAPEEIFEATKALARENGGRFNARAKCWEFHRRAETEAFFDQLCEKAQNRLLSSLWVPKAITSSRPALGKAAVAVDRPERHLPVLFDDPSLQEAFDERAAILEFDAGFEAQFAEQIAFADVQARVGSP